MTMHPANVSCSTLEIYIEQLQRCSIRVLAFSRDMFLLKVVILESVTTIAMELAEGAQPLSRKGGVLLLISSGTRSGAGRLLPQKA